MHLLVIRTSAMGDVALTVPVISAFRNQYPGINITLVTRSAFLPFFNSISGIRFFCPDFTSNHKGPAGMLRLFRDLSRQGTYDYIIDLHDVIRSGILCFFLRMKGIPVFRIDKGRSEKRDIIKGKNRNQLRHSVERYCDVFAKAGFPVRTERGPWMVPAQDAMVKVSGMIDSHCITNIGVAPYAKHDLKVWPEDYMIRLLDLIGKDQKSRYFLFGGREERERLQKFSEKVMNSTVVSGRFNLEDEIALISRLNFMITMDSANMHMAALSGTKVVSIWGGTDPITGFGAWQQPDDHEIRIGYNELACRPCTVFGKGKCRRGDLACMNWLTPERVYEKLINLKML